jgi:hypothetical protein
MTISAGITLAKPIDSKGLGAIENAWPLVVAAIWQIAPHKSTDGARRRAEVCVTIVDDRGVVAAIWQIAPHKSIDVTLSQTGLVICNLAGLADQPVVLA